MLAAWVGMALLCTSLPAAEPGELREAKPVPAVQVLPLPYDQASFQHRGRELSRYHFGPDLVRPFCYPMTGPADRSLTRMGHPHDPVGHRHHYSVWVSHHDVDGADFWGNRPGNRIVHQRLEQYGDGDDSAWLLARNAWTTAEGKVVMLERRRIEVGPTGDDAWLMLVDLMLEAPPTGPVTLGATPFGMIGVRMAKTIGVHDGGGRILNSEGQRNEEEVFRKPALWVDYSGRVTNELTGGIALLDHPSNPNHPTKFHVRNDGWMGACLTIDGPMTIEPDKPVRLRYGLWAHAGVADPETIAPIWEDFSRSDLPPMEKQRR
jgi:hypothetical protein